MSDRVTDERGNPCVSRRGVRELSLYPIIDRSAAPALRSPARTGCSRRHIGALSSILVAFCLISVGLSVLITVYQEPKPSANPTFAKSYSPHAVISIEGDADFATQAGAEGWSGNGQHNNPYIIEGYEIDGLGYLSAIKIGNTTAHFEVRDCRLYNGPCGVFLYGVSNGLLFNNTCVNNFQYGISVQSSSDDTIANSTCYGNHVAGIQVYSSDRNFVRANICFNNGWKSYDAFGIQCFGIDNTVYENYCYDNNESGISMWGTDGVAYSNTCTGNSYGISAMGSFTVRNNILYGNYAGVAIGNTAPSASHSDVYAEVINNNCSDNDYGIVLYGLHSKMANNLCNNNTYSGIRSTGGASYNDLNNNSCVGNGVAGIELGGLNNDPCTFNVIAHNNCSGNGQDGIIMDGSDHNIIRNNTCDGNPRIGIYLMSCLNEVLQGNVMHDSGILLEGGILQNWVLNAIDQTNLVNDKPVYFFKDGNGTAIPVGKGQYIIANSRNLDLSGLDVEDVSAGISLGFCTACTIRDCNSSNNTVYGIYVSQCSNMVIRNSTFSDNTQHTSTYTSHGAYLVSSSDCTLANNTISRNDNGVTLDGSMHNTFANNTIANSSRVGMYLGMFSSYNEIRGNLFENNSGYAITIPGVLHFSYTIGNRIFMNDFRFNNGGTDTYDASHIQAYDFHGGNFWNETGYGNFWSDWQSPDDNLDGIVDNPYRIDGYTSTYDSYPLTSSSSTWVPIPEFPQVMPLLVIAVLLIGIGLRRKRERGPNSVPAMSASSEDNPYVEI